MQEQLTRRQLLTRLAFLAEQDEGENSHSTKELMERRFYGILGYYQMTREELLEDYKSFGEEELRNTDWSDAETFYASWADGHEDEPDVTFALRITHRWFVPDSNEPLTTFLSTRDLTLYHSLEDAQNLTKDPVMVSRFMADEYGQWLDPARIVKIDVVRMVPMRDV